MQELTRKTSPAVFTHIDRCQKKIKELTHSEVIMRVFIINDQKLIPALDEKIRALICEEFGVTWSDIWSTKKHRKYSEPRLVYSFLAMDVLRYTSTKVGVILNNRDHSTILTAKNKIQGFIDVGDEMGVRTNKIIQQLNDHYVKTA